MMKRRNDIKRLRQLVGLLLVALCMVACTTETYPGDSMAADKDEPMPIRLRMRPNINIGTEEEEWPIAGRPMTRATTDDSNSNSSLPTDDYGVFIIDEETYQNLAVKRDASLAGYKTYGYVNEKAKLEGGELKREDGTYFFYPKAQTQATSAYIFVYWPHQAGLTLRKLMDGIEVSVETTDQPSRLKNIDVLAGCIKVSTTNGFKDVSSPASYPQLKMLHVMSHLTIAYVHTTAADEPLSDETLSATLGNVHTKAKLNLFESLQNNSISVSDANTPNEIKLTPNEYSKTPVDNKVTATFYALVPPQNIETSGAYVKMTIINGASQSRNFYPSNSANAPTEWAAGKKYKYNYTYVTGE